MQEDTFRGDGLNLYTYVANNPIKYIDPTGHCKEGVNFSENLEEITQVIVEKNIIEGISAWDIAKSAIKGTLEGATDAIVGSKIAKLPSFSTYTANVPAFGPGFTSTVVAPNIGAKALKGFSKIAGPVAVVSYAYDVYKDIDKYDGEDAVKAVTVTTLATVASIGAGFAISAVGAPVAAVIILGAVVGIGIGFFADWAKKTWIGY